MRKPENRFRRRLSLILSIIVVVLAILYIFVSRVGYDVLSLTDLKHQTATPTGQYSNVSFPSRNHNYPVYAFFLPGQPGRPALIEVHGYRNTRRDDYFLQQAQDLRALGYNVLSIDLSDNGGDTVDNYRISMGYSERWDVLGAFDYLISQGYQPEQIGLVGSSMGATTSLLAAALEPKIQAVWADSPYADTYAVIAEDAPSRHFSPIFVPGGMLWGVLVAGDHIWETAPINDGPTLAAHGQAVYLIHDEQDNTVRFHHGVELYNAYKQAGVNVTFWDVPGLDHIEAMTHHHDEFFQRLDSFFKQYLGEEF